MNVQSIAAFIFVLGMLLFVFVKRKKIVVQRILFPLIYFVMYRTQFGIEWMDRIAVRFPKTLKIIGLLGVAVGFLGMILITYELVSSSITAFSTPDAVPAVKPVLPFEAKGVFYVPFLYWILAIIVIATIHEFSHGVMARVFKLTVKSSGVAFLGIVLPVVPAAFVEPDEKKIVKRPVSEQLAIFAAGPFSNLVFAGMVFLIIAFAVNPVASKMIDLTGVKVNTVTEGSPAEIAGFFAGERITMINDAPVTSVENFTAALKSSNPGSRITIKTNETTRLVVLGANEKNSSKPYLGVTVSQSTKPNTAFAAQYGENTSAFLRWLFGLLYWLFLLSLGIGLFNLLPLGPIDGGRMLHLVLTTYAKKRGLPVFNTLSFALLGMILLNIFIGFIR
ncbi:MAG: site-2 protease family protein [Candidatus Aenigmarchaeota archaeon]|nr:site-2 protease family protein [Candidatus Aenigmarchaeota archaeon]